jgi:hypothetical protein
MCKRNRGGFESSRAEKKLVEEYIISSFLDAPYLSLSALFLLIDGVRFDRLKENVYNASTYSSYDAHVMLLLLFMQNLFFEALLIFLDLTGFSSRPKQAI